MPYSASSEMAEAAGLKALEKAEYHSNSTKMKGLSVLKAERMKGLTSCSSLLTLDVSLIFSPSLVADVVTSCRRTQWFVRRRRGQSIRLDAPKYGREYVPTLFPRQSR